MLEQALRAWAQARARNMVVRLPPPHLLPRSADYDELQFHEDSCKLYAAYAWLSYRLADTFPDAEAAQEGMASTSARIDRILQAESYRPVAVANRWRQQPPAAQIRFLDLGS